MGFPLSPGVVVTEVDLTNVVPNVSTTIGALVGKAQWGPVDEITQVGSENELVASFGKPNDDVFADWMTAANFLGYANNLQFTRVVGASAINAGIDGATVPGGSAAKLIKNTDDYENATFSANELFIAKYPGVLGNSIRVHAADSGTFAEWKYRSLFDGAPSTSKFVSDAGGANDEVHVVVIDEQGKWTGLAGSVLEKYQFVSKAADAKNSDGSTNYILEVLKRKSSYVWMGLPAQLVTGTGGDATTSFGTMTVDNAGDSVYQVTGVTGGTTDHTKAGSTVTFTAAPAGGVTATGEVIIDSDPNAAGPGTITGVTITDKGSGYTSTPTVTIVGDGVTDPTGATADMESLSQGGALLGAVDDNGAGVTDGIRQLAIDAYVNAEEIDINLFMQGGASVAVGKYIIDNIAEVRRDLVAFVSPAQASVVNNKGQEITSITADATTLGASSYAFMDSAYKYQYDKYNDVTRWVPLNGDTAGLAARTDVTTDPWFSPAGFARGGIKNAQKLSWSQSAANKDTIYPIGVNPVVNFKGRGPTLFGDKTMLDRPSAFDRINVRRLFIVVERAIARAAKFFLFELNDEFTRNQMTSMITPFLRNIQGRRGITDFRVKIDETNNTPEVIDSNQLVGEIFIKPARSINFIRLDFVAVRTGVSFDEIGG